MPSPRLRRGLAVAAAALAALVAVYAAFGYLVAPALVRNALVERAKQAGFDLRLGSVRTHPFALVVNAEDVQLADAQGRRLLESGRVRADLAWSSLWRRERAMAFDASAVVGGGNARTKGRLSLSPLEVSGTLALDGARLAEAWRYVPRRLGEAPPGRLDGTLEYRYAGNRLVLSQGDVRARLDAGGTLAVRGTLATAPFSADLRLDAERLPLALARALVESGRAIRVAAGTLSAKGRLRLGAHAVYEGAASLQGARIDDADGAPLVACESLSTETLRLQISPFALRLGEVIARAPRVRATIAPDGSLNLARAFAAPESAGGEPPAVSVERLAIENGRLDFADRSLDTPFATTAEDLAGALTGVATQGEEPARIELAGRVGRYGEARVRGLIELGAPATRTSVSLDFRNLALPDFTPYAAKFAGYRIAAGRLNAQLRYRVRDGRLVGDNRLAFDRLRLGEKVDSAREGNSALDLPLELAVALLTDAQGRINLAIPVRGDLRDPQVDLGGLIAQALRNTLAKIVSAPFRMLASLFGGGADRDTPGSVRFEPGSAALPPPEEETLERLAEALAQRPRLSVAVRGAYDPQADREALQRAALLAELAKRAGYAAAGGGAPAIDPRDLRFVHAAERLYLDRGGKTGNLAPLKPHSRGYGRRLLDALVPGTPIAADALASLARSRAQAVRDALVRHGVAAQRVRVEPPEAAQVDTESGEPAIPVKLGLQSR